VLDGPNLPELERNVQLGNPALLILSDREIEGRVLAISKDGTGYNVTIQTSG
jgi:hypothetical protein